MYLWNDLCLPTVSVHKSHANCVQGPYCKLDRVFPPFSIWPKRKVCRPSIGGAKQGSVTYSMDWEDEVSQIFIVSVLCIWRVCERFQFSRGEGKAQFTRNGSVKRLTHVKNKVSQSEIVAKSSPRFNTRLKFTGLFALKVKVKKTWSILATKNSVKSNRRSHSTWKI